MLALSLTEILKPIARAFGGAILFSLPLLMTMEMWWLGFYMDPFRLCLFILLTFPLLVGLSYHAGFEKTFTLRQDVIDGFVAYTVGFVAAGLTLFAFGVLSPTASLHELIGKVSLQAVPASMGAILARSQLGGEKRDDREKTAAGRYAGEIFLAGAGALFFAFNVAPTEELVLITARIGEWRGIALIIASLLVMHAFTYSLDFHGQPELEHGTPISRFFLYTVVGYVVCLAVSWYVLWTFGRLDGLAPSRILLTTVVLGFPAALGAAAARLIL
jgi:putative integral membrane protein (TIGR02587 family)